jgi:CheY-like chemotaxis protein
MNTRDATANLAYAATLDPVAAAAYLDDLLSSCAREIENLESLESHLQTVAEVREHEASRAVFERDREAYAAAHARVARGVAAAEPRRATGDRMTRIIVADDDAEIRALLAAALRHGGHEVSQARNGIELLTFLSKVSTHELEPPTAVISDVRMPVLSGIDALRNARSLGLDVPFILMTAFKDRSVAASAQALGASGLFDKPFDVDLLLRRVDEVAARAA